MLDGRTHCSNTAIFFVKLCGESGENAKNELFSKIHDKATDLFFPSPFLG